MKFFAVALVRATLPVLRHRHAKVRLAAVQCVTACMQVPDRGKIKGRVCICIYIDKWLYIDVTKISTWSLYTTCTYVRIYLHIHLHIQNIHI